MIKDMTVNEKMSLVFTLAEKALQNNELPNKKVKSVGENKEWILRCSHHHIRCGTK